MQRLGFVRCDLADDVLGVVSESSGPSGFGWAGKLAFADCGDLSEKYWVENEEVVGGRRIPLS